MTIDIMVPTLPESVMDATIALWHKQPGERVARDEKLVDVETDKVVLEVVAPQDGTLESILAKTGMIVQANEVIAKLSIEPASSQTEALASSQEVIEIKFDHASPSTLSPQATQSTQTTPAIQVTQTTDAIDERRTEKRVPLSRLREKIAQRLVLSQQTTATLTTFNEINMQPVMTLREKYKEKFEKDYGVRLGFMSFFAMAVVEALKHFPQVNASIDGHDMVYHGYFDIGIAVSSDRGLVVPVIRDADTLSMAEIEQQIRDFGQRAQQGELTVEELSGGTFTLSNGGVFGSLFSTPILNPPQSAILGIHKIESRPIVDNGEIVIRPMMYVALSYDHRVIDGKEGVQFLGMIKAVLEDPARLIIGI